MNTKQTLLFAFFATSFTFSTFFEPYPFSYLVKLLPMAVLIIVAFQSMQSASDKLFLIGLLFSAMGDFILDYDRDSWFIYGLGSFLIAHFFYLRCFWPVTQKNRVAVIGYIVFGLLTFNLIAPGLGKLFLPVLIYMSVLLFMGIFTLISKKSNHWLVVGGLCFVISDSIIGINKFYSPIAYSHFFIMMTYYFAQYALVKGIFYRRMPK